METPETTVELVRTSDDASFTDEKGRVRSAFTENRRAIILTIRRHDWDSDPEACLAEARDTIRAAMDGKPPSA